MSQRRHLCAIQLGHLGMEKRWGRVRGGEPRLQLLALGCVRSQLISDLAGGDAVHDGLDKLLAPFLDALDLTFGRREVRTMLHAQPVHLARKFIAELFEEFLIQQLLVQRSKHAGFDLVAPDRQAVVADALVPCAKARQPARASHDETGTAHAALRQAREQVLWTPRPPEMAGRFHRVPRLFLASLGSGPEFLGHDAQCRYIAGHPLGRRIHARHALSGVGVLHIPKAIPHEPTDVELVVQDSCSALRVPVDSAGAPGATERAGNAFTIEVLGNLLRRDASDEVAEDPFDDSGFVRLDLAFAGGHGSGVQRLDDAIAVAEAAGRFAVLDSSAQPSVSLFGEIPQEQGVHRPLESDVQVGDVALGERDDVDARKRQSFEQAGGIFLVTAESVQGFGEHDIESPVQRIAHQRLEARAEQRRARCSVIRVLLGDRPRLPFYERAADAKLIRDGRVALIVRRVPRVDPDFHDVTSVENRCPAAQLGLEDLARRLPRKHPHEDAKGVGGSAINRRIRLAMPLGQNSSSSPASSASSFGHDTPAHVERRFAIRGVRDGDEWAALNAAPNASSLPWSAEGVFGAVIARCDDRRDPINLP